MILQETLPKTIVLHGILADHLPAHYNGRFEGYFSTAVDAAGLIECNFPGFYNLIRDKMVNVVPKGDDDGLDEKQCAASIITADELHIMPAVEGAGGKGGILGVLGAVLIAVAVVVTGGAAIGMAGAFGSGMFGAATAGSMGAWAAGIALNMGIGLVMNSLVQPPSAPTSKGIENEDNGIYTGPLNVYEEGSCLPIVLGTVEVGAVIIHTDYDVVTIKNDDYADDT